MSRISNVYLYGLNLALQLLVSLEADYEKAFMYPQMNAIREAIKCVEAEIERREIK